MNFRCSYNYQPFRDALETHLFSSYICIIYLQQGSTLFSAIHLKSQLLVFLVIFLTPTECVENRRRGLNCKFIIKDRTYICQTDSNVHMFISFSQTNLKHRYELIYNLEQ